MGRKPKAEKRQITVAVNGTLISVILHPPRPPRRAWYAYWPGLTASKSTGQTDFERAAFTVEGMLRNGGKQGHVADIVLSDEEFEAIQRAHYNRKQDSQAKARAEKSLLATLEAITAFKDITGVTPITATTPDDCAFFQRKALALPRNWRCKYPKRKREGVATLSPNTVLKWSRCLQAAFQRSCVTAGRKCVRGVVPESKLLPSNPWTQFTWIEGTVPTKRHFSDEELISILDYFEKNWADVSTACLFAEVSLWIWGRRIEVARLTWQDLRVVGDEYHFDFVGKRGVRKWARIPNRLYRELVEVRTDSPYVFAAFVEQLQQHYKGSNPGVENSVNRHYRPSTICWWFHTKLSSWARESGRKHATHHAFRKTALQFARRGEDRNEAVAQDARISRAVMVRHYIDETDEELRQASNRTYHRLIAGLSTEVARRYGYEADSDAMGMQTRLQAAVNAQDWKTASEIVQLLLAHGRQQTSSMGTPPGRPSL